MGPLLHVSAGSFIWLHVNGERRTGFSVFFHVFFSLHLISHTHTSLVSLSMQEDSLHFSDSLAGYQISHSKSQENARLCQFGLNSIDYMAYTKGIYFLWFWRLEVQDQGWNWFGFCWELSLPGLQMAAFFLHPHMAFPWCFHAERESLGFQHMNLDGDANSAYKLLVTSHC